MTLSVILISRNEATNVAACLESVAFADEIIVVDSGSTDDTVAIARAMGAKVFQHDWPGFGPQKNRALADATGGWHRNFCADWAMRWDIPLACFRFRRHYSKWLEN